MDHESIFNQFEAITKAAQAKFKVVIDGEQMGGHFKTYSKDFVKDYETLQKETRRKLEGTRKSIV